jgi:hypothetical protein
MITQNLKSAVFILAVLMLFSACNRALKMLENGDYDQAIYLSTKKLSGKKNKKAKHVTVLEAAFELATRADMRKIEALKKENREENWVKINDLYRDIKHRQDLIAPLLPLYAKDGYKADFRFVKVEELEVESKAKAADYYYGEGKRNLALAEKGDKRAAREAWEEFNKIERYYRSYKDEKELMKRANDLGVVNILFKMENNSRSILPKEFEREIKRISVKDLDNRWQKLYLNPASGVDYDYTVVMNLTEIEVSPELIKEREYVDDKTIEEGWEYILDKNGNVVKDSAGNDIKIPKKVLIKARVFESYQHKAAHVAGSLEFYDNYRKELIYTEPIAVDAIFESYAATFDGDKRALTHESKRKIGNKPQPFPSDEALVLQAADLMKPVIKNKISKSRILI